VSDKTNFHSDPQNNTVTSKSKTPPARSFMQLFENIVVPENTVPTVPLVEMQRNNLDGNAIVSAGGLARSFSHPQLHRFSSHISIEENPVTVNTPIFLYGGLNWGTVWMVLSVFWGVRQFSFMRGLIWGTLWMVLGGFWGVRQFSYMGD
jgi:hypothetical protein